MNKIAISLVIISAFLHALRNMFNKKAGDKEIFIWLYEIFALLFFLPPFIFMLLKKTEFNKIGILFIILSGISHFIYWILLSKSYEKGDLSHVYPIMRSSPALVLVLSFLLLGEKTSLIGILGIITIVIGIYIINLKKIDLKNIFEPIKAIIKEKPTRFALFTMISVALYSVIDKKAVEYINPLIFGYLYLLVSMFFLSIYIIKNKEKKLIKKEWSENKKSIMFVGFIAIFGYYLILYAFTIEKLSYVAGLRQLSIVFAILLGGHVLKEKNKSIRLIAGILIFIGAFLISIAN